MRGFLGGVVWGGIVTGGGLAVLSLLMPLPQRAANDPGPVTAVPPAAEILTEATPSVLPEAASEPVPEVAAEAPPAPPPETEPLPDADAPVETATSETEPPPAMPAPEAPVVAAAPVTPPVAEAVSPPVVAPEPVAVPAEAEPVLPLPPEDQALLDAEAEEEGGAMFDPTALPQPAPIAEADSGSAAAAAPEPSPEPPYEPPSETAPEAEDAAPSEPEPEPALQPTPAEPLLDKPEPGLNGNVAGVTTDRLPSIAAAPTPTEEPVEALPDPAAAPAWQRFAAPFEGAGGKPLYAVILIDDGEPGLDRAALAALPLPVSIALDPTAADAAGTAALYRAAGKEVLMLATAIPQGATAQDLAVTFESHARALSEAVAVLDPGTGGFQNNRPLATEAVPIIKDQGRGLITWAEGLNAGDQVARREGVPSAVIFRRLDADGESPAVMRRYLDRAAFKAAQDGRVIVAAKASADTMAALLEWTVEGRAGTVALAPASALLKAE